MIIIIIIVIVIVIIIIIVQFQKIHVSILPSQKGLEFPGGGGFCKAKKFKEMYEAYYMYIRHRGNTFFDVTVTGQWSSPSACLPWKVLRSIDETDRYSRGLRTKNP